MELRISPSIGVARLGNSTSSFCLSPEVLGGLPFEADAYGNKIGPVKSFKDESSQVKRQGQVFKILTSDDTELTVDSPNVASIEWTVHLANKKAAWYQYSELEGNLLYGEANSYKNRGVAFRNESLTTEEERQTLVIDPGPRSINGVCQTVGFDKREAPLGYPIQYPPEKVSSGTPITTLGELKTDNQGRLVVLGGFGHAGGNEPLTSYGGSDTWHDDISDGPVYCTVNFNDGTPSLSLQAWVIVGSPDFAPEILNISTLSDSMFDVAVRSFNLVPGMFHEGEFDFTYKINYQRDILPIIQRLAGYQWVANVQSMISFAANVFDFSDPSDDNKANRQNYFSYFRRPNDKANSSPEQPQSQLFKEGDGSVFPMMPLNSGSNSVSNETIVKFLALNDTQYFMLSQWADGAFENNPDFQPYPVSKIDQASVGNCVGLPMCPGIEVTWSVQNKNIYSAPFVISDQIGNGGYDLTGLTPSRDECEGGGCEPGDLTKRMACPWQADFFQCTVQPVNFTNVKFNKDTRTEVREITTQETWIASGTNYTDSQKLKNSPVKEPLPPTYYSYWWPPQSPWDVLTGEHTLEGQKQSNLPAGLQVNYARGINSFVQMVEHWSSLAFIRNLNAQDKGFPYYTETERTNELFSFQEVGVGQITGNGDDNGTTIPVFYIDGDVKRIEQKGTKAKMLVEALEKRAFKEITVAGDGLGLPRSGTRMRI